MNQLYAEAGVKRKDNMTILGLRTLMIVGIVVGILLMLLGGVFGIGGVVIIVVLVFLFPKLNVEYEYVFVDGQLDFDRITGKAKRKTILRVDMEQMEIVAPEGSHALDGYTYVQYEKKDFSSGDKTSKPYIIIASVEDKKYRITFEPTEKMITMMRQKSPRKIAQY
ncbi:MAG: hypothetical protein K0S01_2290 [Herbinix sp.]|jgi:hypothetical protein|nr:hypothetical protein [Herbinix sp.]